MADINHAVSAREAFRALLEEVGGMFYRLDSDLALGECGDVGDEGGCAVCDFGQAIQSALDEVDDQ